MEQLAIHSNCSPQWSCVRKRVASIEALRKHNKTDLPIHREGTTTEEVETMSTTPSFSPSTFTLQDTNYKHTLCCHQRQLSTQDKPILPPHTAANTTHPRQDSNQKDASLSSASSLCCLGWLWIYSACDPFCAPAWSSTKLDKSQDLLPQKLLLQGWTNHFPLLFSTTTVSGRKWATGCNYQNTKQKS